VAVGALLSWAAVSGPGEAALVAVGIAAAHGKVDLASMVFVAWAGAMVGGAVGWLVGLRFGRRLVTAPGPFRRARLRVLRHGDRLYERYGPLAVYFAPAWAAGLNGMQARRFLPANAVSALIWALAWGIGSYAAGPSIADLLSDIGLAGILILLAVVLATIAVRVLRTRREAR
jgi:membrane protein DedA with SNARE-associated domain